MTLPDSAGQQPPSPEARQSPVLQVVLWTLWVMEVIAFVYLFGCAVMIQASGDLGNSVAGILGTVLGLGLFLFGLRLSFDRNADGSPRVLAGGAVMLLAAFVVFGSCTLGLQ